MRSSHYRGPRVQRKHPAICGSDSGGNRAAAVLPLIESSTTSMREPSSLTCWPASASIRPSGSPTCYLELENRNTRCRYRCLNKIHNAYGLGRMLTVPPGRLLLLQRTDRVIEGLCEIGAWRDRGSHCETIFANIVDLRQRQDHLDGVARLDHRIFGCGQFFRMA